MKNRNRFEQLELQLELPVPPYMIQKEEKKEDEQRPERGTIIINIFGDEDQ